MVAMVAIDDRTRIASSHRQPEAREWISTCLRVHRRGIYVPPGWLPRAANIPPVSTPLPATTPMRRPKSIFPTGTGRCVAHEHSDRTTGTRSQERYRRARACCCLKGGKNKCGALLRNVDGLCGVLVIVGSHHGLCSRTGTARPAPRARARRAWVRGVECGTTAHRGELQGCRDRSRES